MDMEDSRLQIDSEESDVELEKYILLYFLSIFARVKYGQNICLLKCKKIILICLKIISDKKALFLSVMSRDFFPLLQIMMS